MIFLMHCSDIYQERYTLSHSKVCKAYGKQGLIKFTINIFLHIGFVPCLICNAQATMCKYVFIAGDEARNWRILIQKM